MKYHYLMPAEQEYNNTIVVLKIQDIEKFILYKVPNNAHIHFFQKVPES